MVRVRARPGNEASLVLATPSKPRNLMQNYIIRSVYICACVITNVCCLIHTVPLAYQLACSW